LIRSRGLQGLFTQRYGSKQIMAIKQKRLNPIFQWNTKQFSSNSDFSDIEGEMKMNQPSDFNNIGFDKNFSPDMMKKISKELNLMDRPKGEPSPQQKKMMELFKESVAEEEKEKSFSDFEEYQRDSAKKQDDFHLSYGEDEIPKESGVYLKTSDNLFPNEEYESKREKDDLEEEAKFGDYPSSLVRRPKKGFMWGLGTEQFTKDTSSEYFTHGKLPTIKQLIRFLEIFQVRDIKAVDCKPAKIAHLTKYAILGS